MAGRVSVVLLDNGATAITVPTQNVQLVIGTCSAGTVGVPFSSTSAQNIHTTFGDGPLPEAAAMIAAVGGVPVCVRATSQTAGSQTAVTATAGNTGTSVVTVTGNAFDTYSVVVSVQLGGTIATGPIGIQISLDNGRTLSPVIQLGVATTYAIPNTGLTLNFAAGTTVTGDSFKFGTVEPMWNTAGIQVAINAFLASSYGRAGVGSVHIVGGSASGGATGTDMVAIGGQLQTARTNQYVFTRAYISARDAKQPAPFGIGETEAAWMTALNADHPAQALNADTTGRISVCAAYWNVQSQYTNGLGVQPLFRRSVAWSVAQRQVLIPPQRMPSRVKDGALAPIAISVKDSADGFVYHDESVTPGLDTNTGGSGGKFTTTTRIQGKNGVFCQHANLFSPTGSSYNFMPQGLVIDLAASISYQVGVTEIDDDLRQTPIGTIDPRDATTIQNQVQSAIRSNMTVAGMLVASPQFPDGCVCTIDQTANVGATGSVPIQVQVFGKFYVLTETISVGFAPGTG